MPLAALALSGTACGYAPIVDTTEPYEFFNGEDRSAWCVADEEAWTVGQEAVISGPHFAVGIQCRFLGEELPHEVAEQAPGIADLTRASEGSEFVISQFSLENTPTDPDGLTRAWVEVGDREFELGAVPKSGDWVALTAPVDESAVLWVEDDGRAQGLDLRSGSRVDPVASLYDGLESRADGPLGELSYEVDIEGGSSSYQLSCDSSHGLASRDSWLEDLGWAPDGQVFLTIDFGWCSDFGDFGIDWALDPEQAFAIEGADPVAPAAWEESAVEDGFLIRTVFTAPADDAEIDIAFTPFGEITSESGEAFEILDELEPTEWVASFS